MVLPAIVLLVVVLVLVLLLLLLPLLLALLLVGWWGLDPCKRSGFEVVTCVIPRQQQQL